MNKNGKIINKEIDSMLVTKMAPDFTATTVMPDNSFKDITLSDYRGKKVVLFFYPLDFTFVCEWTEFKDWRSFVKE